MTGETIRTIAAAALARFDAVIDWLGIGGGKMQGPEYLTLNPNRADTKPGSFSINRETGHWGDFATGDRGGDLVSLAAYLRSEKQGAAAVALAGFLGIEMPDAPKRARIGEREAGKGQVPPAPSKPHGGPDSAGGGDTCIMPAPENAPAPPVSHARHGKPSHRWAYLAACAPCRPLTLAGLRRILRPSPRKRRRGFDSPEYQGGRPPPSGFFTSAARQAPMGGPCGRASALPVPWFRSVNPHGSARPD